MQKQGLKADKNTVSILTKQLSDRIGDKRRVPRGVAMVEQFLKTQPEDVDEVLVNSLLDVFCKLGDMPRLEAGLDFLSEWLEMSRRRSTACGSMGSGALR